jgi:RIO-like serine/threonine protein kinase
MVHRPLYPEKSLLADSLTVLSGMVRFVRKEGYWPKAKELTALLKADKGAVVYRLQALVADNQIARTPRKSGYARYQITGRGWETLGIKPLEPWRRPPTRNLIAKAINAAARKVAQEEAAAHAR